MNTKTTLVVLLLAVILGSAAIYKLKSTSFTSTNDDAAARLEGIDPDAAGTPLLSSEAYRADAVDQIVLTYADGSRYVFRKVNDSAHSSGTPGSDWQQLEPIPYHMTGWSIQEIANRVGDLTYSTVIKENELKDDLSPARLGFEPALATIELTTEGNGDTAASTVVVQLGKTHLAGRGYVRLGNSGPAYVTGTTLHEHVIDKDPKEWRDKKVFPIEPSDISRLIVDCTDPENESHYSLSRIQGNWHLIRPVSVHANATRMTSITSAAANIRLRGFVEDNPSDLASFGLDTPDMTVTAEVDRIGEDGSVSTESYRLLIGHRINLTDDLWYAMRLAEGPSDVFTIPRTTLDSLRPEIGGLIGRSVLTAKAQDILTMSIDNGSDSAFSVERAPEGWTISIGESGTPGPAVAANVDQIVTALTQIKDSVEIDAAGVAASMPVIARIGVTTFGSDSAQQRVIIGTRLKEAGENLFAPEGQQEAPVPTTEVEYVYTLEGSGVLWVSSSVPALQLEGLVAAVNEAVPAVPLEGDSDNPMK